MSRSQFINNHQVKVLKFVMVILIVLIPIQKNSAQANLKSQISIDTKKVEGLISPLLYGQFMEFMFEDIKGGLYAELVRNRGFEDTPDIYGLSRYWEQYPDHRNDDGSISFKWDDSVAYPVSDYLIKNPKIQHSLRVNVRPGISHGIFQSDIPVRKGVEYKGYIWLKTTDYQGKITVTLEPGVLGGKVYSESEITDINGDWKKYEFVLRSQQDDPLSRFSIIFQGRGALWIDQVSLIPGDARDGVRADVFEKVRGLQPAFIRWPGGNVAQDYHWQWGIGPRDNRPVWTNMSWRNEPEPSDFGTVEYIKFCRNIGAEPSITINIEGSGATPEEAAAWVEYCNGPESSRYGAMRASDGYPEPFKVKYWEIGNEIWGDWVRGHSDATTYANNYNRYFQAIKSVDPSVKFIAVGDNDMEWNKTVLQIAGRNIDYLAIHHYYGGTTYPNLMARPLFFEKFYKEVEKIIRREVRDRKIGLSIDEWGLSLPESRQYSIEAALYGARLMNVFERTSPLVSMSSESDLINGWIGGIIQASRHGLFVSPLYYLNQMYNSHLGSKRLKMKLQSPVFDTNREGTGIPYLDAVASISGDEGHLYLKLINTSPDSDMEVQTEIKNATVETEAEMITLSAKDLNIYNSFSAPDAIHPVTQKINVRRNFIIMLPKHSVSVITITVHK
jgi:alpha-N-arabinofuranosidase